MQYRFNYKKHPGRERTRFYAPDPKDALVTVITPFYNAGKYFEQTFNSVMNQTFPWFEWIIVNDGTTNQDDVRLLHELTSRDRRITVVTQPNQGLASARNTGVAHASCDLIVPLDADDVIAPQYLECTYWALQKNPEAAWCFTDSYGFQAQEYSWKPAFDAERMKTENILTYASMIRKKDILEVGGYRVEKQSYYEDWRFWLNMLSHHKRPVRVYTNLFWYRRLENSMLSDINRNPEKAAFAKGIIAEAAKSADGSVKAVEYPFSTSRKPFAGPQFLPWDRRTNPDNTRKKVLWLIPWMVLGGADKFNLDAISGLQENGFDNHILTTNFSDNPWRQKFEDITDEIFCLPDFLDPADYPEFISYYIQSRGIDVLMLSNSYSGYYMIPWIREHFPDLAIVDYVHSVDKSWREGGYARTSGALHNIVDKTYVCNSQTRNDMIEMFHRDPDSVECLYIGVDQHYFDPGQEAPGYLHTLLNLAPERKIVLFPCRIDGGKRPFFMLDIAQGVQKVIPDIAFVVAGDGELLEPLKKEIAARAMENTVYCIGQADDMRKCYRDSHLTLICSLIEGLTLTAYESLSMGVPVVSSRAGGQGDLIGSDVGALLPLRQEAWDLERRVYDPEEIRDYVRAVCRILTDEELYRQLSENCRKKIENGFSLSTMVEKLTDELVLLTTDARFGQNRRRVCAGLATAGRLAAEYYVVYLQWQSAYSECLEVWNARCWFKQLWEDSQAELQNAREALIQEDSISGRDLLRLLAAKIRRKIRSLFRRS